MSLLEKFIHQLKQFSFIQRQQKQLLAVSGGVDSVVLCELMFKSGFDFVIAHCNFQLREAESERDEQFVRSLGVKYGKEVLVKKFNTEKYAAENKVSIQVAARELRYKWFHQIISDEYSIFDNATKNVELTTGKSQPATNNRQPTTTNSQLAHLIYHILTAHHANDNIETVLMNFFKGTGISGMHGILPVQGKIVRPLLFAKKDELVGYAMDNNLPFVEDSSNAATKYTRNYFRHNLLPLLKEVYPNVEDNLLNNIQRLTEAEELYKQSVDLHKKKLLEYKGNEIHIPVLKLQKTSPLATIIYEIIRDFGFTSASVPEVIELLEAETGKYTASSKYRIIKNRNWLIIAPNQSIESTNILIEDIDKEVVFSDGELHFQLADCAAFQIPSSNTIAALDAGQIVFPLVLRKWKQGDYFYPLGMKKKKKLSRFFIDQKLSKTEKEKIWVLEMNKKIIWIVGHRIDDRFKVQSSTRQVLKINYNEVRK